MRFKNKIKMKRILVIGGVVLAIIALVVFNRMTSRKGE